MAYFQKTIVRYERDPRAAEDADFYEKWCCPCFLGTDDEGDTHCRDSFMIRFKNFIIFH